jgi:hypothetical protein
MGGEPIVAAKEQLRLLGFLGKGEPEVADLIGHLKVAAHNLCELR